ncbi:MAG: peptidoglycan DD-metalloendopeptidase family protein [Bacteroidota bacterium]|nr:peptidoglycan DD-metalloendopeptidase family protein [Bacteroidota bacterium]
MIRKMFLLFSLFSLFVLRSQEQTNQQGQTKEELQKQQRQLQKEIEELNASLVQIRKSKKQSLSQLAMVQRKIAAREQLVNNINREIRHIDDDIYNKQIEIYRLRKELDTLKLRYAQSIVFAYKNRSSYEYLNFLFSAPNFNDAIKRMMYLKSYRRYRETEAQTIAKTQDLLQQNIGTLNSTREERKQVLQNQSSQLQVLEQDKKEKDQVVRQLKDQEKDLQAQITRREKERIRLNKALDVAIRRAREEAERQAKLARQKALEEQKRLQQQAAKQPANENTAGKNNKPANNGAITSNEPTEKTVATVGGASTRSYSVFESTEDGLKKSINFENNKGRLPWPVSSGFVTDRFGTQQIPGTRLTENNDGIFIATPVGSPVKCVADGKVYVIIPLDDSYSVMVQHGKYFTIYNKLSSVSVSSGQEVNAGTVVGKAGEDFDGSGKIEFRVMVNGSNKFVDPERWLKPR